MNKYIKNHFFQPGTGNLAWLSDSKCIVKIRKFKAITRDFKNILILASLIIFLQPVLADSSSPLLAAYYNRYLAICGNKAYEWNDFEKPQLIFSNIKQVGVGKRNRYALTFENQLLKWNDDPGNASVLMENVKSFFAGQSGVFVIRNDNTLWEIQTHSLLGFGENLSDEPLQISNNVLTASVGDSANYYVTRNGNLFVHGLAHRGQYGDGKLTSTDTYIQTFENAIQVAAHTGHALALKEDGSVWGTGGNIYGPLGSHGYGDKAIQWGLIFEGASAIATGSSHSAAITPDGSLWIWGRNQGVEPEKVMSDVTAVALGSRGIIALAKDSLWQWSVGDKPERVMNCR